ncbi:MAG: SDR family oxidoreductase, partial [Verrucomicrobiota bacterium]
LNGKEGEEIILSQGQLSTQVSIPSEAVDIMALQARLPHEKSGKACYESFKRMSLDYGVSFQGIEVLYYSKEEALARLSLPKEEGYVLPPGLLDSAVQTCMGLDLVSPEKSLSLPSSVKEVNLYGDVSKTFWAYARRSEGSEEGDTVAKYDIDLLSEKGEPLLNFKHLVLQRDGDEVPSTEPHSSDELVLLHPGWEASKSRQQGHKKETTSYYVFLGAPTQAFHSQVQQQQAIDSQWIGEKPPLASISEIYSLVKAYKSRETPTQLLLIYDNSQWETYSYLCGLFKTLQLSDTRLSGKLVGIDSNFWEAQAFLAAMEMEGSDKEVEVRYLGRERQVRVFSSLLPEKGDVEGLEIRSGGVYLITGGAGGIGLSIASYLSGCQTNVTTVLLGRRLMDEEIEEKLSLISGAVYYSCDVSDRVALESVLDTVRQTYGKLDGVLHAAGNVGGEGYSVFALEDVAHSQVLRPKLLGCENLDALTSGDALDFMIYFSSISGTLEGVIGLDHSDYAIANAYLNQFAHRRNRAVERGERQGYTMSINWPLWQVGMYHVESDRWMESHWGLKSLSEGVGVRAFEEVLGHPSDQVLVLDGEQGKRLHLIGGETQGRRVLSEEGMSDLLRKVEGQITA